MARPEGGWIKIYRQIRHNFLWPKGRKYTKLEAWLDMLLQANHAPEKILIDNQVIEVQRGQFITSTVQLANRWKWDRKTVVRFLQLLFEQKMCTTESTTKWTSITIVNYEFYQGGDTAERTTERTPEGTGMPQQIPHKQELKNYKKDLSSCIEGDSDLPHLVNYYQNNIGVLSPITYQALGDWLKDLPLEVIIKAIEKAVKANKRRFDYIEGILRNWHNEGLTTLGAIEAQEQEREAKQDGESRANTRKSTTGEARKYNNRPLI
jgi:DnaD/phage-associated family protein